MKSKALTSSGFWEAEISPYNVLAFERLDIFLQSAKAAQNFQKTILSFVA